MPQTPMYKGFEACYVNRLNVFSLFIRTADIPHRKRTHRGRTLGQGRYQGYVDRRYGYLHRYLPIAYTAVVSSLPAWRVSYISFSSYYLLSAIVNIQSLRCGLTLELAAIEVIPLPSIQGGVGGGSFHLRGCAVVIHPCECTTTADLCRRQLQVCLVRSYGTGLRQRVPVNSVFAVGEDEVRV